MAKTCMGSNEIAVILVRKHTDNDYRAEVIDYNPDYQPLEDRAPCGSLVTRDSLTKLGRSPNGFEAIAKLVAFNHLNCPPERLRLNRVVTPQGVTYQAKVENPSSGQLTLVGRTIGVSFSTEERIYPQTLASAPLGRQIPYSPKTTYALDPKTIFECEKCKSLYGAYDRMSVYNLCTMCQQKSLEKILLGIEVVDETPLPPAAPEDLAALAAKYQDTTSVDREPATPEPELVAA